MNKKTLPCSIDTLNNIVNAHSTPFHLYDEKAMRDNAKALKKAFAWNKGFKEYFAVKGTPNPYLMKLLKAEGFGSDCSSLGELILSEKIGNIGENIMFTSNDTPAHEFKKAYELGAIINFDDISHIEFFEKQIGALPELVCFRYNPGALKEGNAIIGNPEDAKYGFTREQLFEGYKICKSKGVKRFGLHTMVASNELQEHYFTETAQILFDLVVDINKELGIDFEFINIGGGIGIPYKPEDTAVNLDNIGQAIEDAYNNTIVKAGCAPLKLYMECARMITGPYGYLVSKTLHIKKTYKTYVGLDACMADLMRPALYGAYHHITVVGKDDNKEKFCYDVTGSLCENNDKFAIDRQLPKVEVGDIIVIHDTGAHGHSMGFNYNAKTRSAELLLRQDGSVIEIRRAETLDDLFATLDFDGLDNFKV